MDFIMKLLRSRAPAATLLIRVAVGCIFVSEGIQRFLFRGQLGVSRFEKILAGLAAIPLIAVMCVAKELLAASRHLRGDFARCYSIS